MEFILTLLFEVFFETGVALLWEGLTRLFSGGATHLRDAVRKPEATARSGSTAPARPIGRTGLPSWVIPLMAYTLVGAGLGWLSLWVIPPAVRPAGSPGGFWHYAHLLVSPLLCGAVMAAYGAWRLKRGLAVLPLDRFLFGWAFAQALVGVRFFGAA